MLSCYNHIVHIMLRRILVLASAACVASAVFAECPVDTAVRAQRPQSVGLVLSGGGSKGIAHIGVIKVLEENNIPIDYIAGTSMGAIVGGLYAAGYTTDEMMDLLLSRGFSYWSTGKVDPNLEYFYAKPMATPNIMSFPVPRGKKPTPASRVPASIVNAQPMNFAFMELFAGYTAQCGGNFDRLFVPFRCVASDVARGHKVVHRSGDLGDAIRTSMSFPIVFQPIKVNGQLLYDGGIFDNFPVDVMIKDFDPDIIIGVDVSASATGPQTSILDQIDNLVMREQTYALPADKGIKIRVDANQYGLLDFPAAKKIYQLGYETGMSMIDSIKGRVTSRISQVARNTARGVFKSQTPYVRFDSISVTGGTPDQNRYIEYLFRPAFADTFGIAHARESFYRAITPGKLQNLFPQALYNDSTDLFKLTLDAAPKDDLSVGVGGYVTSSTSSYLFLQAMYRRFSFSSLNASVNAWIGQSYMAAAVNAMVNLPTAVPSSISLMGTVSRQRYFETDHLFYQDRIPTFIVGHAYFGRLAYNLAAGSRGKVSMWVGGGHLYNSYFRLDAHLLRGRAERDHTSQTLGQAAVSYTGSTLNYLNYPTEGHSYNFTAMGNMGTEKYRPGDGLFSNIDARSRWLQLESRTRNYWDLGTHWAMGVESDVLLSTRKLTGNYNADIVNAPDFNPTPASYNAFNHALRSNSFAAVSLVPVYKYNSSLSARISGSAFMPIRKIESTPEGASYYGNWFNRPTYFAELDVCYALPVNATVSGYVNYTSAGNRSWSIGMSVGLFLYAPKMLR